MKISQKWPKNFLKLFKISFSWFFDFYLIFYNVAYLISQQVSDEFNMISFHFQVNNFCIFINFCDIFFKLFLWYSKQVFSIFHIVLLTFTQFLSDFCKIPTIFLTLNSFYATLKKSDILCNFHKFFRHLIILIFFLYFKHFARYFTHFQWQVF